MSKPVLIVIDMQRHFFDEDLLVQRREVLCRSMNELIAVARDYGCPVIWVKLEFNPDLSNVMLEMKKKELSFCIKETEGSELLPELDFRQDDHVVVKTRYSSFFNTNLDDLLDSLTPPYLIIAGINTHACVRTTAIDAYQRDYEVIFAEDCVWSYDKQHHDVSVQYMCGKIGECIDNKAIGTLLKTGKKEDL